MHLRSRILAAAAVILMAAAAIYGSTREISTAEDAGSKVWYQKKETIYFWYSDDALSHYINSAAVSFGEREGVRVIPVLTEEGEYLEAINNKTLEAEQVPDAYLISNDSLEKAYLAGLASEIKDVHGLCCEENFPKAALDAVTYAGKTVAYPLYYETSALVYNKSYLETWARQQAEKEIAAAGSESKDEDTGEPTGGAELDESVVLEKTKEYLASAVPDTVDEILQIADTFDVPEGVEGVMKWDVSDIFYNYWIVGNYMIVGGDVGDEKANTSINNPETIACLEVYKALNQFFYIESDTVTYDSVIQDFIEGKSIFTIATTDVVAKLAEAQAEGKINFEYGIAMMPDVSEELQSRSMSVTTAVVVNGYSEKRELANEFASYLTGEFAETLYERTGKDSANKNIVSGDAGMEIFFAEYSESVPLPKMMETGNFWLQLEVLFARIWNGEDTAVLVRELADSMAIQMGE